MDPSGTACLILLQVLIQVNKNKKFTIINWVNLNENYNTVFF